MMTRAAAEDKLAHRLSTEPSSGDLLVPRQGRSRAKLDRLLAAGTQLIGERGFDATHISDVTELGGCSVGVFYQRFADKDAFFAAVRRRWIDQTIARFDELLEAIPATMSATDLLTLFVRDAVALFRENVGLIRAFLVYEADHPEASAPMLELAHAMAERLAGRLVEHELVAHHSEPGLEVRFAMEVLRGTLVYLVLHGDERPLGLDDERLPGELVRMLGAYLGIGG